MECPSLLNREQFYRSSCKRYSALMFYFMHSDLCELMLNQDGLWCVNFKNKTSRYVDSLLKEQTLLLMSELTRIHVVDRKLSKTYATLSGCLFLKKKSSGLLRLDNALQQAFYEEGVLDLAITGYKEGTLYVYTVESKRYVNYVEYSYLLGAYN